MRTNHTYLFLKLTINSGDQSLDVVTLKDLNVILKKIYPENEQRRLVIAAPPNSYGTVNSFHISVHGSPPKGYADYYNSLRKLFVSDGGLHTRRRVKESVSVPELDLLENKPGIYSWTPEDGIIPWISGSL